MSYSEDLRKKVVEYVLKGNSQQNASEVFNINRETVNKWVGKYKKTGEIKDKKRENMPKKVDPQKLLEYIEKYPDKYLREIAQEFNCSDTAIRKRLKSLGITRKKKKQSTKNKISKKQRNIQKQLKQQIKVK